MHKLLALPFLVVLAALGNYFSFPLFFGVDLIFGSIATLVAVIRLGILPGVVVAVIGGLVTVLLWQHPYAMVIFVAEAVFVGMLRERVGGAVRADAVFWLVLGLPLGILFYAGIMNMALPQVSLILLKQPLNGIFNAVMAVIVILAWDAWRRPSQTFDIGSITEIAIFTAVLFPSLILIATENRHLKDELEVAMADELKLVVSNVKGQVGEHLVDAAGERGDPVPGHSHRSGLSPQHVNWVLRDVDGQSVWQSGNWQDLPPGEVRDVGRGLEIWLPTSGGLNTMIRWKTSRYQYGEAFTHNGSDFIVLTEHPAAPIINDLHSAQVRSMLILVALVLLAGPAAILLSRLLTMPINQLTGVTRQITETVDGPADIRIPRSRLTEVDQLAGDFNKMTDSLSQALADMARLARQDALTGICNRRRIMEYLEEEFLRAKRYGGDFCVLFYDLDEFKKINDELGHSIGDEVLLEVTKVVQGLIRQTDHIGRWGGDEFLLILPQTDLDTATSVAAKIGETVAATRFSSARLRMTISVGVAEFSPRESIKQLIARVDDALYRSKRADRTPAVSPAPGGDNDKPDDIALH